MRYRPSKRVVWLVIPLIPVAVMSAGMWFAGENDSEAIATRGTRPPTERKVSLFSPASWPAGEWVNDRMDAVLNWEHNPWKQRDGLGSHFQELRYSDDPKDKAEFERLRLLGKEWHERILARYPELAIQPVAAVPKESNGSYQWNELLTRLQAVDAGSFLKENFPTGFKRHFEKGIPLDAQAAREWLDTNRALIDEIRAIGLLPGHSTADIPPGEMIGQFLYSSRKATLALLLDARVAAELGDVSGALESIRAATGLSDHLGETESPTLLSALVVGSNRSQIRNAVFSTILPSLPAGQVDIAEWEKAVNPRLQQPDDYARTIRGEWNLTMRDQILPVLSDTADRHLPSDPDHLVEAYTRYMQAEVRQAGEARPGEPVPERPPVVSSGQLSRRSQELLQHLGTTNGFGSSWNKSQVQEGLALAAFAILKGQPVPDDPVSGEPYVWNSGTRKLSLPDLPHYRASGTKPLTLPKP